MFIHAPVLHTHGTVLLKSWRSKKSIVVADEIGRKIPARGDCLYPLQMQQILFKGIHPVAKRTGTINNKDLFSVEPNIPVPDISQLTINNKSTRNEDNGNDKLKNHQ